MTFTFVFVKDLNLEGMDQMVHIQIYCKCNGNFEADIYVRSN